MIVFSLLRTTLNDLLEMLNNFHERIHFIYEKSTNQIDFLDVSIILNYNNNKLIFKHFKKPIYTGRIIHNLSNQPHQPRICDPSSPPPYGRPGIFPSPAANARNFLKSHGPCIGEHIFPYSFLFLEFSKPSSLYRGKG